MLDKIYMNQSENYCILFYSDGRQFMLRSGSNTSIIRFLEWFLSDTYYHLLNDEQFEMSQEITQVIYEAA